MAQRYQRASERPVLVRVYEMRGAPGRGMQSHVKTLDHSEGLVSP